MRDIETTGVIVGKFLPFHKGHEYLIREAKARCDRLFVFVGSRADDPWPAEDRALWIEKTISNPNMHVLITPDNLPNEPEPWAERVAERLPSIKMDYAFTSEDYGDAWAEAMGCEHVCIDIERRTFPMSGTQVRSDLFNNLDLLPTATKVAVIPRIVTVGAESTGTTTLAKDLAEHYETAWVPEYGRTWWEARRYLKDPWTKQDFHQIVNRQQKEADTLAEIANRVLICDTDALVTEVFEERYLGTVSEYTQFARGFDNPTMYLITGDEIPWVQDGTRESGGDRSWMQHRMIELVHASKANYYEIVGTPEKRLSDAILMIDYVLEQASAKIADIVV